MGKAPPHIHLDTDFLSRWTDGEPMNVLKEAVRRERLRCIGIVLREFGIARLAGDEKTADVLDRLAVYLEHPEGT